MTIYKFNYTILPTIPLNIPIQQPTNTQYTTLCGAIGTPTASVEPYVVDICGYFPSTTNPNVQFLMQKIGEYYSVHRVSLTLKRKSQFDRKEVNEKSFPSYRILHGHSIKYRTSSHNCRYCHDTNILHNYQWFINYSWFEHRTITVHE